MAYFSTRCQNKLRKRRKRWWFLPLCTKGAKQQSRIRGVLTSSTTKFLHAFRKKIPYLSKTFKNASRYWERRTKVQTFKVTSTNLIPRLHIASVSLLHVACSRLWERANTKIKQQALSESLEQARLHDVDTHLMGDKFAWHVRQQRQLRGPSLNRKTNVRQCGERLWYMHCALRPILITNHESPYPKFVRTKSISLSKASANAPKFTSHHTLFYTPQRGGGWFRQTTKIYIHVLHLQSEGLEFLTKKKDKLTH